MLVLGYFMNILWNQDIYLLKKGSNNFFYDFF